MIIKRSNYLIVTPESSEEKKVIEEILQRYCVYENPEKDKKQYTKRVFYINPEIVTYNYYKNSFYIYKGNKNVYNTLLATSFPKQIIDERINKSVDIECFADARDEEQRKAIEAFTNNDFGYGILNATPSTGKTFISLKLASIFKQKTLILVDMTILIEQFIESILKFTNVKEEEIGIIRGKEINIDPKCKIIISTIQTLNKNIDLAKKISNDIGYLIIDEVHVASCKTFQDIIPLFKPQYQIGLSGTPFRDDKMEFLILESVGPIVYTADRQKMLDAGSMLLPLLRPIFIQDDEHFYKNEEEYKFRDVVEEYYLDPRTINKISNLILYHYNKGDSQLVICKENNMVNLYYNELLNKIYGFNVIEAAEEEKRNKITQLNEELEEKIKLVQELKHITKKTKAKLKYVVDVKTYKMEQKEKLRKKYYKEIEKIKKTSIYKMDIIQNNPNFIKVKIINGDLNKSEREKIIEDTNSNKTKIILTTTAMDKAVSINRLNILYLLFSTRERANTIQRVGRVIRAFPGKKEAIVYDVIYDHYMSFYQFYNNKENCRFEALKQYSKYYSSVIDFIKFLEMRFKKINDPKFIKEFEEKYSKKYIIKI